MEYVLDILLEIGLLGYRPSDTFMNPNIKLSTYIIDTPFSDANRYRQLVRKLIYLSITRLDILYAMSCVNQFMQTPTITH